MKLLLHGTGPLLPSIVALAGLVAPLSAAQWTVERQGNEKVKVLYDGKLFTEYLTKNGSKPTLWPILSPSGRELTRAYPMRMDKAEKHDHPHQRSFWFTHGDVNGIDFWDQGPGKGSVVHREFVDVHGGPSAVIETKNDWLGPDGKKQCEDERTFTFRADGDSRIIDVDVTLKATAGPVKFGDTKEGTFGIRVPTVMAVESKKGGHIINSQGQTDGATWGKSAAWVDYHGPLGGEVMGIAILNHPTSFRYPTTWHVRDYGLFAANPFGLHDFTGSKDADGSYTLPAGESMTLRYRVIFHPGDEKEARVAEAFEAYSKEVKK
jgi:Family of unknown function (DUF6807)